MTKNNKTNSVKIRYEWLDIIKAICIISVVVFHIAYKSKITVINTIWNYLDNLSGLYKVTIFYCVAGITLNNEKLKDTFNFLLHKFKKLYLKVIAIGFGAVLLHNAFINIGFYKIGFSYSGKIMNLYCIKDFLVNTIYTLFLGNREVILGAFWFVYSLIICFIMLGCIEFIVNRIKFIKNKRECRLFITFILMFISILLNEYFNINIPRFSNSLVGLFLLDFTNWLFNSGKLEYKNIYLLIASIILFLYAPFYGAIAMNTNSITSPYFLIIVIFAALYLILHLSKKMENKKYSIPLKYIGKNSFSIMAFHFLGFKIGGCILNLLTNNTDISLLMPEANNFLLVIYYALFGIGISLVINYILKRVLKFEL